MHLDKQWSFCQFETLKINGPEGLVFFTPFMTLNWKGVSKIIFWTLIKAELRN
ncbi:MAG: hypothetical protein MRERV_35c023 [Mycoplasmataceae bacterium RV_VA103A]|nr:MAG: hypothetical protein MRERV_35c023 [Mycoplasmataceae bacterium RV_VA103A]